MVTSNKNLQVLWIGSQIKSESYNFGRLKHKHVKLYKKCIYGSLTLTLGDYVFILNADAKNPDSIEGCDIGKIRMLYEVENKFSSSNDPFRAIVQWYSWPQDIPQKYYDSEEIFIDFDKEVIEEHRPYDNDISIETIQNKCLVLMANVEDSAEMLLNKKCNKIPTFVCRYKFEKYRVYKLLPLEEKKEYKSFIGTPSSSKHQTNKKNSILINESETACRNLYYTYESDCDSPGGSDILNYSIINRNELNEKNNLKIRLRVSQKLKSLTDEPIKENLINYIEHEHQTEEDPLSSQKKVNNLKLENTPTVKKIATRRKSILKTPCDTNSISGTPKRNIQLSNIVEERFYDKTVALSTPSSKFVTKSPSNITNLDDNDLTPCKRRKLIKISSLTPTISSREKSNNRRKSDLQILRENLHVSAVPDCLPCREIEYENIYNFIEHKITTETGGCIYISGVPGTGKTATVTRVIKALKLKTEINEIPNFEFVDINGMRLTEPRQAYVQIYKQLIGKSLSWEQSYALLEKRFATSAPRRTTTVLLVDELDILCNRRQDVVYNLLDWPSKVTAKLIVITIANTMDLPERLLLGKVTSRLGLTRLTFQPYTHKQLQEIVTSRLIGSDNFKSDAVQLVARKVAAVSGDARRALDICRRATEIAEEEQKFKVGLVNMVHVQKALEEMISSAKVQAIKSCSKQEKVFLQAITAEVTRTGLEEVVFNGVYTQIESIVAFMGFKLPSITQAFKICSRLGSQRLIICEHSRNDLYQRIILNVSTDDIHFALQNNLNYI